MRNPDSITIEELDERIAHFEDRLTDFIITEDQIEFIQERLKELKTLKSAKL
ncbi:hypothetical protein [Bacillus salipaludis]|uniref:Uncharacterized protein n=1 Tax=Bacillus salipaludis TaxID=2547811 RepID=A0AA90R0L8_9BACI|nr:hypothetical protein [Bacillus salipaludis]MDQ6600649.1 hypothetical protein [Bacillus salipaludis]